MIDVVVCTNAVNLRAALAGARPGRDRPVLLIHEAWRISLPTLPRVTSLRLGVWSLRIAAWLAQVGLVHTLYLPHDRFNRRLARVRARARQVVYLDDGLDTHRRIPRNMQLPAPPQRDGARPGYITFDEFQALPEWLDGFRVERCGSVVTLAGRAGAEPLDLAGTQHLMVESPGLDPSEIIGRLGLPLDQVLVLRHPVPGKRSRLPEGCRIADGGHHDLETTLLQVRAKTLYFGETMALVFCGSTGVARHNTVLAQLSDEQRHNLCNLRWLGDHQGRWAAVPGLRQLAG